VEPHKELPLTEGPRPDLDAGPQAYFDRAREFVEESYPEELEAIRSTKFEEVSSDFFFREYVWVVHATGFSAKAVGRFMPKLMVAYGMYDDLAEEEFEAAFERIRRVCNNRQKAKAVWKTARLMNSEVGKYCQTGWEEFKQVRLSSPEKLRELPYVGPVTCFHLARNIGLLECVKPDLHLVRMAEYWGFPDCVEMCKAVRPEDMPLGVVDLIFWYAAATFGTLGIRKDGAR
jgi:endonuclease III